MYLKDGSAETTVHASTLRSKLLIKPTVSPSSSTDRINAKESDRVAANSIKFSSTDLYYLQGEIHLWR